jgi:hypothetical protein
MLISYHSFNMSQPIPSQPIRDVIYGVNKNITLVIATASVCLLGGLSAMAQNQIVNGDFATGNLTGWAVTNVAPTTVASEVTTGNPSGSALLARNDSTAAANGNYLYQIIPVVNGAQYKLSAQWKGDLLNGGTGRNWAEVFVNFTASNSTFVPGLIRYKKATDGGPNATPMPWDWESITTSPDSANPGPADGVFTATDNYMTLAFNLGGRAQISNNTQPGYYWVDNVSVTPWPPVSAPVFTNALRAGGDIVMSGTKGPANGAYEMLRSTNVGEPVSVWQGVGIRPFDGNGNFNFTNPIGPGDPAACYRLHVVSSVPVFPPSITAPPQDLSVQAGQNATFNVTATGTAPLTYRWYYNTNTLLAGDSGPSLTLTNVQVSDSGKISVTVSNLLGADPSTFATLTVTNSIEPPGIVAEPGNQIVTVGQTANFITIASGALPLFYQWFFNTNTALAGETNSTLTLLNVNTNQAGRYSVTITNPYGSTNSAFAKLNVAQEALAFPEAEGYGKNATGGRGGAVIEVTTLNPTGAGSLGAALTTTGARTVVFRVAGTITGNFNINRDNITIAGQTAPGDGITIRGRLSISANNVIIRYIRVRNDPAINPDSDALDARGRQNIILDHVSVSWSTDEVMSLYLNKNVTIQWSMITEACVKFVNGTNTGHQFGGIWGNEHGTYHHNLIAHNVSRNMRWASGGKWNDYRNNVIYNWEYNSCYGGEDYADATWNFFTVNMIANYYKYGPATDSGVRSRIAQPSMRAVPPTPDPDGDGTDRGRWYVTGNYVHGYPAVTVDNWLGVSGNNYIKLNQPWPALPINQQTPQDAYAAVLAHVGCAKPNRDSVDARIINEVATGTATYGNNGILTTPSDVGGWPTLASGTPLVDTDHDGMPDTWESAHGLNPNDAADRNHYTLNPVYPNLEVYLNDLGAF